MERNEIVNFLSFIQIIYLVQTLPYNFFISIFFAYENIKNSTLENDLICSDTKKYKAHELFIALYMYID